MLLNKNLSHMISQPSFVRRKALLSSTLSLSSQSSKSSILHYGGRTFTKINPQTATSPVSTTLTRGTSIVASCNGLVLLRFENWYRSGMSHYVFNPLTGERNSVTRPLPHVGLAVDLNDHKFPFKLVTVTRIVEENIARFDVLVPCWDTVVVKSQVDFVVSRPFDLMPVICTCLRPVYVHECLHWLMNGGHDVLVFDIEREKARIMSGPATKKFNSGVGKWFGSADGVLKFVYTEGAEIVIKSQNYLKDEWQVKHRISKICDASFNNNLWDNVRYLFLEGKHLYVMLRQKDGYAMVFVLNVLSDKMMKKMQVLQGCADSFHPFFSYFPTLAKVGLPSNPLLLFDNKNIDTLAPLQGLQRLLKA